MVASAAPVTMLVAPGPTLLDTAYVCSRFRIRAKATAECTMACSLRPSTYGSAPGSSISACSSAWPRPATLPWPKMPKQPSKNLCSTPSDSLYCWLRNLTVAWATVSCTVSPMITSPLGSVGGRPAGRPRCRAPRSGRGGRRSSRPAPRRGVWRSGHHVQVVHVVAGRGDAGPVPAVRHQHRVAIMDLFADVDVVAGRGGRAHEAQARLTVRAGGDLEVVDLLQLGLGSVASSCLCAG